MGLFDRFKRRVKEVADEVNTEDLTVTEDSTEGQEIIAAQNQVQEETHQSRQSLTHNQEDIIQTDDDDWEFSAEEGSDEAIEALTLQAPRTIAYKTHLVSTMMIGKTLTMTMIISRNNLLVKKRSVYRKSKNNWRRQRKPMQRR